jgi:hypothetical protein
MILISKIQIKEMSKALEKCLPRLSLSDSLVSPAEISGDGSDFDSPISDVSLEVFWRLSLLAPKLLDFRF